MKASSSEESGGGTGINDVDDDVRMVVRQIVVLISRVHSIFSKEESAVVNLSSRHRGLYCFVVVNVDVVICL